MWKCSEKPGGPIGRSTTRRAEDSRGLAFAPWTNNVRMSPDLVLPLFLPALLFYESLTTSLRGIRANLNHALGPAPSGEALRDTADPAA